MSANNPQHWLADGSGGSWSSPDQDRRYAWKMTWLPELMQVRVKMVGCITVNGVVYQHTLVQDFDEYRLAKRNREYVIGDMMSKLRSRVEDGQGSSTENAGRAIAHLVTMAKAVV